MIVRRRSLGSILTEEALVLALVSIGAIAGLAVLGGGLTLFANNTQNGGGGTSGMATGNIPAPTNPQTGNLYSASGPTGSDNNPYSDSYSGGTNGGGLYSLDSQEYEDAGYSFGVVAVAEEDGGAAEAAAAEEIGSGTGSDEGGGSEGGAGAGDETGGDGGSSNPPCWPNC